jgi:hypothetical protein
MKTALVLSLSLAAALYAADPKPNPVKGPEKQPPEEMKRLGSLTWNPDAHKLIWVVQKGAMVNGEFVPSGEQQYEISPDEAVMSVAQEQRGFDNDEAATLHHLLDVLSLYCAESVVWWEEGQGTPVTPGTHPAKPATPGTPASPGEKPRTDPKADKPVRVGQPDPGKKPKYEVPPSQRVAQAQPGQ